MPTYQFCISPLYLRHFWGHLVTVICVAINNTNKFELKVERQHCLTCVSGIHLLSPARTTQMCVSLSYSGPPADHWALVSGLPTYVAENGFVSASGRFITLITRIINEMMKTKGYTLHVL